MPGGMWFATGPFLLLAVTALIIYLRWDRIPEGTTKNPFAPLVIAATMVRMPTLLCFSIVRYTRQIATDGPAARAEQRFKNVQMCSMFSSSTMMPDVRRSSATSAVVPMPAATSGKQP